MCRIPIAAVPSAVPSAVVLALLLGGCVPYYRVPSGAPFASVRLMTSTDDRTTFNVLDPAKCPSPRPQVLAGTGKQLASMGREDTLDMAGMPPEPPSRTRERKVVPGKRLYVAVTSYAAPPADDARCAAGVSFVPQAGGQYEIRYWRDDAATQCSARVLRLQPDADGGAKAVQEPTQQGFRALRPEYLCEAGPSAGAREGAGAGTR
ncbi:MAG: hypothetical protein INH12_01485 [Cupriavidus sp.]|nr:hypothetical protein [Cupriavidus sp.]MCA3199761.1 hypothetical protein [Cupriavidus sp.]MCA3205235.1 hypothetical protein [Cupriavidus sp.]MCA3210345.1 hypothetical protein [Cupriavidus sp.]MCA3231075.1 hypothetical protein [Cupriavidus sp.]